MRSSAPMMSKFKKSHSLELVLDLNSWLTSMWITQSVHLIRCLCKVVYESAGSLLASSYACFGLASTSMKLSLESPALSSKEMTARIREWTRTTQVFLRLARILQTLALALSTLLSATWRKEFWACSQSAIKCWQFSAWALCWFIDITSAVSTSWCSSTERTFLWWRTSTDLTRQVISARETTWRTSRKMTQHSLRATWLSLENTTTTIWCPSGFLPQSLLSLSQSLATRSTRPHSLD